MHLNNQDKPHKTNDLTRRRFLGNSAALASMALMPAGFAACGRAGSKPNSKFNGVQIGTISYSFRSMPTSADDILGYLQEIGLSSVELMGNSIEQFAGAPEYTGPAWRRSPEMSAEERAAFEKARSQHAEQMREWRLSVSMDKFRELRNKYNRAGINIDISKIGAPAWTDEEIDYAFNVAKTLGSRGITFEISMEAAQRMAPFAEKHGLYAIMHNHGQPGQPGFSFEEHLAVGDHLMLNLDIGHYWGATGKHPNGIIEKLHDRIVSLHIKDKTGPNDTPPDTNMPFGQGSTPLGDILQLISRNGWPITADLELEYPIPEGSNAVLELKKCTDYCRNLLQPA